MTRRPRAALGVVHTARGDIIIRKFYADRQSSWILIADGSHEALRLILPDWRSRSPSTRTQITPPKPLRKVGDIIALYHTLLPQWIERAKLQPATESASVPVQAATYRTLGELVKVLDHEAETTLRTGTRTTYQTLWTTLLRRLPGTLRIEELTRERIQALIGELVKDGYAASTIHNLLVTLGRGCTRAVDDGRLIKNPLSKVKLPKVIARPRRFPTREDRDAILRIADKSERDVQLLCHLLLGLGLRRAEALSLRWETHVDLERRMVQVGNTDDFTTKSARSRSIPIADRLHAVLLKHRQASGYVLMPEKEYSSGRYRWAFNKSFHRVVQEAGLPWIYPHLCRHAFASIHAQNGVNFFKLAGWLGHSVADTTSLYSHMAPGFDADINRGGGEVLPGRIA